MHSCSDTKGSWSDLVAAQHMFRLQPLQSQRHAAVWPRETGEEEEEEGREGEKRGERRLFFNSWALQGLW